MRVERQVGRRVIVQHMFVKQLVLKKSEDKTVLVEPLHPPDPCQKKGLGGVRTDVMSRGGLILD